jgi:hypothetical protein
MVRGIAFWIVALGVAAFVLWSYLRDHPEIWQALLSFAPLSLLLKLWRALRRRFGQWAVTARRRLRRRASGEQRPGAAGASVRSWFGVRSPRERVLYHYLGVLRRAKRRGFPRRAPETPDEYGLVLGPRLLEAQLELDLLTEAFVEAKYSQHEVEPAQVGRARAWGQRIRAALRTLKSRRSLGDRRAGGRD